MKIHLPTAEGIVMILEEQGAENAKYGSKGPSLLLEDAAAYLKALIEEERDWRECACYDPKMEGPIFKGWNRSALDRCRKKYL